MKYEIEINSVYMSRKIGSDESPVLYVVRRT